MLIFHLRAFATKTPIVNWRRRRRRSSRLRPAVCSIQIGRRPRATREEDRSRHPHLRVCEGLSAVDASFTMRLFFFVVMEVAVSELLTIVGLNADLLIFRYKCESVESSFARVYRTIFCDTGVKSDFKNLLYRKDFVDDGFPMMSHIEVG